MGRGEGEWEEREGGKGDREPSVSDSQPSCSRGRPQPICCSWLAGLEGWGRTCTGRGVALARGGGRQAPREPSLLS